MTEDLQTLLHERADRAALAAPDLAVVVSAGRARVRRRRTTALVAAVVASVLLAGGGLALLPRSSTDSAPAERPHGEQLFLTRCHVCREPISWAEGSTIHEGATTIDVGHEIARYVRTGIGYVFSDTQGQVWSVVDGHVTRVGSSGGRLVSDEDGALAGWVDGSGKKLSFDVLDQTTGEVQTTTGTSRSISIEGSYLDGQMIAVDGDAAYWRDGDRTVQEVLSGSTTSTGTFLLPDGWQVLAVRHGVAVEGDPQTGRTTVGPVGSASRTDLALAGSPLVSPDGRWVAGGVEEGRASADVYRTDTGAKVSLGLTAWTALPYEWLSHTTLAVLVAERQDSHYELMTCSVTTTGCVVTVADLGEGPTSGPGNGMRARLPTGALYYPYPHG